MYILVSEINETHIYVHLGCFTMKFDCFCFMWYSLLSYDGCKLFLIFLRVTRKADYSFSFISLNWSRMPNILYMFLYWKLQLVGAIRGRVPRRQNVNNTTAKLGEGSQYSHRQTMTYKYRDTESWSKKSVFLLHFHGWVLNLKFR